MATEKVELIPWDPSNEAQYQRMYDQRVACGWRMDEVPEWKEKQLKGSKFLYWIVISESLPGREELLKQHLEQYPAEKDPIIDTATNHGSLPRTATLERFTPIGHTALEICPSYDARFSFPEGTMWLKSLYVSWALQAAGLGRSAMRLTESIARLPPHNAKLLALDTMQGAYQSSEKHLRHLYEDRGLERPKGELRTSQEWYARQGWRLVEVDGRMSEIFPWVMEKTGEVREVPVIYMTKSLVD